MSELQKINQQSPIYLIQQIKTGGINPKLFKKAERQVCVEVLCMEGWPKVQIAELLKCSTKTIQRDIHEIREKNCFVLDEKFIEKCIGRLEMITEATCAYLMHLAREKGASLAERLQAAYLGYRVMLETTKEYESLGYLGPARSKESDKSPKTVNYPSEEEMRKRIKSNLKTLKKYGISFDDN